MSPCKRWSMSQAAPLYSTKMKDAQPDMGVSEWTPAKVGSLVGFNLHKKGLPSFGFPHPWQVD